jgi:hypothetical protein
MTPFITAAWTLIAGAMVLFLPGLAWQASLSTGCWLFQLPGHSGAGGEKGLGGKGMLINQVEKSQISTCSLVRMNKPLIKAKESWFT